jgi:hypothetical protein
VHKGVSGNLGARGRHFKARAPELHEYRYAALRLHDFVINTQVTTVTALARSADPYITFSKWLLRPFHFSVF